MPDQVAIHIPRSTWNEESAFFASAHFRDRDAAEGEAPATIEYRIDCLTSCREIRDWTSVPAGEDVRILIQRADNAIQCEGNRRERRQLTVAANRGTDAQATGVITWVVDNLKGSP